MCKVFLNLNVCCSFEFLYISFYDMAFKFLMYSVFIKSLWFKKFITKTVDGIS